MKIKKNFLWSLIVCVFCILFSLLTIDLGFAQDFDANQANESDARSESAVFNASEATLTFYYDDIEHTGDIVYKDFKNYKGHPEWNNLICCNQVNYAVFDDSFSDFTPLNCSFWFSDFHFLKNIDGLENLNISQCTDTRRMFSYDYVLSTDLDLSSWDFSNVTNASGMFDGCYLLTHIIFPETTNLQNCEWIEFFFNNCYKLEKIENIENFQLGKAISIDHIFQSCEKLNGILNLSKWDMSTMRDFNWAFDTCSSLTDILFPQDQTIEIKNATATFQNCSSLKTINLTSFDLNCIVPFARFSGTQYMFFGCTNLERIFVNPNTDLPFDDEDITLYMFHKCENLKGMNGTVCDPDLHGFLKYACIDGKDGQAGYFSIKEAQIPTPVQLTYNGFEQEAIANDSYLYNVENNVQINAGEYSASASLVDPEFMNWSDGTNQTKFIDFSISKCTLIAKYVDEAVYQGQQPQLLVDVWGFINDESASSALNYVAPIVQVESNLTVGTYTLIPQGGSSTNYDFTYESGTLTVNPVSNLLSTGDFWLFVSIFCLAAIGIAWIPLYFRKNILINYSMCSKF